MTRCSAQTVHGEQCKGWAVHGSDKCSAHLGRVGRPTTFDEQLGERLVTMLRSGCYLGVAVSAAGVPMSTFKDWLRRGRSEKLEDRPYAVFRERVETARAEGEARMVAVIARAAQEGDWRAAITLLEREFPERWGPVSVRQRDDVAPQPADVATSDPDDPFREVDELAARRRTRQG